MKHTGAKTDTIDLNLLATFAVVAEEQGFAQAARRLGVQRSSVSRSIAALEERTGLALFRRTTRVVALTPEGAALYSEVNPQLAGLQDAMRNLAARDSEVGGTLRLTTTVEFGAAILAPALASFLVRYPSVRAELEIHNRVVDLVKEGFDGALRPQPTRRADSSLVSRKVMSLYGTLYASPQYLAARGTPASVADLASHDWISFRGLTLPAPVPRMPPPRVTVDDMLFVREAIRLGLGVGPLPTQLAQADVVGGRLVRLLPRQVVWTGGLFLVHPPTRHLPRRMEAFRDHLVEHLRLGAPE